MAKGMGMKKEEHSEHNIRSQSRPAASRPDAGVGTADSPLAQRG
jgi:hypothetical protein